MRKRKINPAYLRHITSTSVTDDTIEAYEFARTIQCFSDNYLSGLASVIISGNERGNIKLKLPAVSYMIRLLAESCDESEMLNIHISLNDGLLININIGKSATIEDVALIVKVAKYAGFQVKRDGDVLSFSSPIHPTAALQIYAVSVDEFMDLLVTTLNM